MNDKTERCPSTCYDRLANADTRCALPEGHKDKHSDGGGLDWCGPDCRCSPEERIDRLHRRIAEVVGERATGDDIADLAAIVEDAARWRGLEGNGGAA